MSDLDLRYDQIRRRRYDAQTGRDREVEARREQALMRRNAVPLKKAKRQQQMLAAFRRTAIEADLDRKAAARGYFI